MATDRRYLGIQHRRGSGRIGLLALFGVQGALADGLVIDKVYHPYVDALEKELAAYKTTDIIRRTK